MLNGVQLVGINFSKRYCGSWVQKGMGEVTGGFHDSIARGSFWHRTLVRGKLDGLGCAFGTGLWNVEPVALVVFGSRTDVPAVYTMRCPGAAIGWGLPSDVEIGTRPICIAPTLPNGPYKRSRTIWL